MNQHILPNYENTNVITPNSQISSKLWFGIRILYAQMIDRIVEISPITHNVQYTLADAPDRHIALNVAETAYMAGHDINIHVNSFEHVCYVLTVNYIYECFDNEYINCLLPHGMPAYIGQTPSDYIRILYIKLTSIHDHMTPYDSLISNYHPQPQQVYGAFTDILGKTYNVINTSRGIMPIYHINVLLAAYGYDIIEFNRTIFNTIDCSCGNVAAISYMPQTRRLEYMDYMSPITVAEVAMLYLDDVDRLSELLSDGIGSDIAACTLASRDIANVLDVILQSSDLSDDVINYATLLKIKHRSVYI